MSTETERTKILEMIEQGVISAQEGIKLLDALDGTPGGDSFPELESRPEITAPLSSFSPEPPDDFEEQPEEEPEVVYHPPEASHPPDPAEIQKWKRWWVIPMWVGVGITVLGGALMYWAFDASGVGFWFACAWFPFMLGVLVMALAWASRTAPWLHVRIQQKPGETPQKIAISFPLPIRLAGWGLRTFGHHIPNMEGVDMESMMKAIDASAREGTPFFVDVNDEDGEHVQVFIG